MRMNFTHQNFFDIKVNKEIYLIDVKVNIIIFLSNKQTK